MKAFLKFLGVAATILLLSAVLAPILFDFLPYKFERIFNRLVMIFTLIAIFFFVKVRRETFVRYGLLGQKNAWKQFWIGFISGFGILSAAVLCRVLLGGAEFNLHPDINVWIFTVLKAVITGLVVGLIEEFFFRGVVFTAVHKRFSCPLFLSMVITSIFYSLLHFVGDKSPFIGPDPTFSDSLLLMRAPIDSLADWRPIWPAVVGLFLFGMVLNDVYVRTGSLYPAIGLHAGCVFFIKIDGIIVDFSNAKSVVWGSSHIYDGAFGWLFLILLGFILRVLIPTQKGQAIEIK